MDLCFLIQRSILYGRGRWGIVIWGLDLMALCVWQSVLPCLFISNRIFEYLGERTFSAYLLHPVIIFYSKVHLVKTYEFIQSHLEPNAFFICATLIIALVLVFAEFTYRFIEVPGIKFGRKLITQRKHA